jgi:TonB family protein
MRRLTIALVTLVSFRFTLLAPQGFPQSAGLIAEADSQASPPTAYPESPDGLKYLLHDLFASAKSRDARKTSQLMPSLAIPSHKEWFLKTFGEAEGARLEEKYVELHVESDDWLRSRIDAATKNDNLTVDVSVYQKSVDTPVPVLRAALDAMVHPVPIYSASIRASNADKSPVYLAEFVYLDGTFRHLERQVLQALSTAPPQRLRIGGNVQRVKLIKQVAPVYPELALQNRTQGTVRLHVILATDGTVMQTDVVDGPPALQMAAVEAVRQWRYKPTLLNNIPVEVDTLIDVTFSLR